MTRSAPPTPRTRTRATSVPLTLAALGLAGSSDVRLPQATLADVAEGGQPLAEATDVRQAQQEAFADGAVSYGERVKVRTCERPGA